MKKELYHDAKPFLSIYPVDQTGANSGDAIIDTQGYEGALIVCASGALTIDTVFALEHGDAANLSDAADVPDADLVGSEPTLLAATDNEIKTFSYIGTKRYLRIKTSAGSGLIVAAIILHHPRHAPVQT